jgi:hypothetical protein
MTTSRSVDAWLRRIRAVEEDQEEERESTTRLDRITRELQTDEHIEAVLALLYEWFDPVGGNPSIGGSPETASTSTGVTVQDIFDMVKGTDLEERARRKALAMQALDNWRKEDHAAQ